MCINFCKKEIQKNAQKYELLSLIVCSLILIEKWRLVFPMMFNCYDKLLIFKTPLNLSPVFKTDKNNNCYKCHTSHNCTFTSFLIISIVWGVEWGAVGSGDRISLSWLSLNSWLSAAVDTALADGCMMANILHLNTKCTVSEIFRCGNFYQSQVWLCSYLQYPEHC